MARELLTAARTFYVRSDALYSDAPGKIDSAAGACKTWQQAISLAAALDFGGQTVTIQHGSEGAHTFTVGNLVPTMIGGGLLHIVGQSATNTILNVPAADAFYCANVGPTPVKFSQMKLVGGGLGQIQALYQTTVLIGDGMEFGAATFAAIWVHDAQAQVLYLGPSVTGVISGSQTYFVGVEGGMFWLEAVTIALTGTPAFSAFALAQDCGRVRIPYLSPVTFVGSATGSRYAVNTNGVIDTAGAGATFLPGNSAGIPASGGQYA